MSKLRKFFALSASDWVLIAQALTWFGLVEVGLRCLALQRLLRIIQRPRNPRTGTIEESRLQRAVPQRAAYCVSLAARMYPLNATCLKQALTLCALLARRGIQTQVFIGAARATEGQLDAHAWLECQGKVLLGEPAPGRYSTLCALSDSLRRAA